MKRTFFLVWERILPAAFLAVFLAGFSACASTPPEHSSGAADASASAAAALAALDNGGVAPAAGGANAAPAAKPQDGGGKAGKAAAIAESSGGPQPWSATQPLWVRSPGQVYDAALYVAASASGADRAAAEKNAFANLTNRFGQNIQAEQEVIEAYRQAEKNGALQSWSMKTDHTNIVKTSSLLDTLLAAQIDDHWFDGKSLYHAVAVMDKAQAREQYAALIRSNLNVIESLTTMSAAEKNSLDAYARYRLAAAIADVNETFCNVLTYIGPQGTGINPASLKKGGDYRFEALEIAKSIPIQVKVVGDRDNRVKSAFSQALSKAAFRTAQNAGRYTLNIVLKLEDAEFPGQANKFVYYDINAELCEGGTVLLPYHIRDRAGHVTREQAENRALTAAEKKIGDDYASQLSAFLSTLIPMKK